MARPRKANGRMEHLRDSNLPPNDRHLAFRTSLAEPGKTEDSSSLLHPALLSRRVEFVARVPGRQAFGVGDVAGHVEREPGQHDEAREVPLGLKLVLRRVV